MSRAEHDIQTLEAEQTAAQRHEKWTVEYDARQREYATCRFLGQLGDGDTPSEAAGVVELHDFATRCSESLALA